MTDFLRQNLLAAAFTAGLAVLYFVVYIFAESMRENSHKHTEGADDDKQQ